MSSKLCLLLKLSCISRREALAEVSAQVSSSQHSILPSPLEVCQQTMSGHAPMHPTRSSSAQGERYVLTNHNLKSDNGGDSDDDYGARHDKDNNSDDDCPTPPALNHELGLDTFGTGKEKAEDAHPAPEAMTSSATPGIVIPQMKVQHALLSQFQNRIRPAQNTDYDLMRILEVGRCDVDRAVDIFNLWYELGAPPTDEPNRVDDGGDSSSWNDLEYNYAGWPAGDVKYMNGKIVHQYDNVEESEPDYQEPNDQYHQGPDDEHHQQYNDQLEFSVPCGLTLEERKWIEQSEGEIVRKRSLAEAAERERELMAKAKDLLFGEGGERESREGM